MNAQATNYFTLFELPEQFALEEKMLEARYFALQRVHHPDRFAAKPPAERQQAAMQSMRINDAYQTLKSPLKRAQYLLSLQGIRVGGERDTVKPGQALLIAVMESRERLEEAKAPETLTLAGHECAGAVQTVLAELETAFTQEKWQDAAQLTLKLGYLTKLADEIAAILSREPRIGAQEPT